MGKFIFNAAKSVLLVALPSGIVMAFKLDVLVAKAADLAMTDPYLFFILFSGVLIYAGLSCMFYWFITMATTMAAKVFRAFQKQRALRKKRWDMPAHEAVNHIIHVSKTRFSARGGDAEYGVLAFWDALEGGKLKCAKYFLSEFREIDMHDIRGADVIWESAAEDESGETLKNMGYRLGERQYWGLLVHSRDVYRIWPVA